MNNKGILPVVLAFYIIGGVLAGVCIAHIPAWSKAKADHKEAEYQKAR